ncbi:uncharacterized protein EV420DRAFT_740557 [Desarmillaria tabescens]|uniref:Uncharacterized protein n=1 Tax=Armillaria tabescens TaxID=1929756 RepID=A0AA39JXU0_ARMTA|nr:uncharacterized protein EV420DRAFT_740557 [Desarmillaria tabescens]KAK0450567.1 hypothetical protein EV420DRAFT_740557 [Desarmillaria tabescens]
MSTCPCAVRAERFCPSLYQTPAFYLQQNCHRIIIQRPPYSRSLSCTAQHIGFHSVQSVELDHNMAKTRQGRTQHYHPFSSALGVKKSSVAVCTIPRFSTRTHSRRREEYICSLSITQLLVAVPASSCAAVPITSWTRNWYLESIARSIAPVSVSSVCTAVEYVLFSGQRIVSLHGTTIPTAIRRYEMELGGRVTGSTLKLLCPGRLRHFWILERCDYQAA